MGSTIYEDSELLSLSRYSGRSRLSGPDHVLRPVSISPSPPVRLFVPLTSSLACFLTSYYLILVSMGPFNLLEGVHWQFFERRRLLRAFSRH